MFSGQAFFMKVWLE